MAQMIELVPTNGRWFVPIGPAPEGWQRREHCSHVIPHRENAGTMDSWQDDDMNRDHYVNVRIES